MALAGTNHPGSICLVANELDHFVKNSGIGAYYSLLAPLLVNAGWRVHILYVGFADNPESLTQAPIKLRRQGVSFSLLSDFETPAMMRVRKIYGCHGEREKGKGVRILQALEELHRVYHFDLIEFPDFLAFGFRSIQARRTGRCLGSARLCVKLHGTSAWQREGDHRWPDGPGDLSLDFLERYAFENADVQMAPSRYMLDYVERQGWNLGDAVVAHPFPHAIVPTTLTDEQAPSEVVFFGRLEVRKGLDLFLDAASDLPAGVEVTFLGRDTVLPSGQSAAAYIKDRLCGRAFKIHTDLTREEALNYLAAERRLYVIPSLAETFGLAVAECAVNGLPFIATLAGGTPEVIPDPEIQNGSFFEPTSRDLRRSLNGYFKMPPARRIALRVQARKAVDPEVRNRRLTEAYDDILERYRRESAPRLSVSINAVVPLPVESPDSAPECDAGGGDPEFDHRQAAKTPTLFDHDASATVAFPGPLVSVAIPYYNLGRYLPATLEALAAQTYPHIEVIIVDDGSTCPVSIRVLNELQQQYPQFRFTSQKNSGPGVARNRALAEARGEFFIPVDADNVATPTMVERFVYGMMRNPDLSVLTCFLKAFNHDEGIDAEVSEFVYMPTGGPFVASCFENVYGDTNAIFRTQQFRDAGGFETDPDTFIEDWETFVKLAAGGLKIDVIPDALFYYRIRGDNRSLTMSRGRSDRYPFVQRMIQRRFVPLMELATRDADMLWLGIAAFGNCKLHQPTPLASDPQPPTAVEHAPTPPIRYRVADTVNYYLKWITPLHRMCRSIIRLAMGASGKDTPPALAATENEKNTDAPVASRRRLRLRLPRIRAASASRAA
jgi:glycosyltransferase involved in cell wall biosynthesis